MINLGPGQHFGEWWGCGIQRGYGIKEKRFSLFNVSRWRVKSDDSDQAGKEVIPDCCNLVPVVAAGIFSQSIIDSSLNYLTENGSQAAQGFNTPEGIIIYHRASNTLFKKLIENDQEPKGNH